MGKLSTTFFFYKRNFLRMTFVMLGLTRSVITLFPYTACKARASMRKIVFLSCFSKIRMLIRNSETILETMLFQPTLRRLPGKCRLQQKVCSILCALICICWMAFLIILDFFVLNFLGPRILNRRTFLCEVLVSTFSSFMHAPAKGYFNFQTGVNKEWLSLKGLLQILLLALSSL